MSAIDVARTTHTRLKYWIDKHPRQATTHEIGAERALRLLLADIDRQEAES